MENDTLEMKKNVRIILHCGFQFIAIVKEKNLTAFITVLEEEKRKGFIDLTKYSEDVNKDIKLRPKEVAAIIVENISNIKIPPPGTRLLPEPPALV